VALHRLPEPVKCVLWNEPERVRDLRFDTVTVFADDEHSRRTLVKCPECGQLYFYEMREETDFANGEDPIYRSYIPVPGGEHAAALSLAAPSSLLRVRPALHVDWPSEREKPAVYWWRGQSET
jgi:hypothetical protein